MKLVIVESPAKAKTIGRYLGAGYRVRASMGHVRDLPSKTLAVDTQGSFLPEYETLRGKGKTLTELKKAAQGADEVLLAMDPDREGEIIAYHLQEALKKRGRKIGRISFQEVTPAAVRAAVARPRPLDDHLVAAQQARRVVDRLVGYTVSPFLWRRAGRDATKGLSAGRVQTAALRLVCEREQAIAAFTAEDYFSLNGRFSVQTSQAPTGRAEGDTRFEATLHQIDGKRVGSPNSDKTERVLRTRENAEMLAKEARDRPYRLQKVTRRTARRRPPPPFTTSTLQQAASARLRLSPKQTMRVAQQLFEGVDVGGERAGLITYMRTDSVRLSDEAVQNIRRFVERTLGPEFVPPKPQRHKTKAAAAQEAHEAIRPTALDKTPKDLRRHLTPEQHKLYQLIYYRAVASQMADAVVEKTAVEAASEGHAEGEPPRFVFRAEGEAVQFPGYRRVYDEVSHKKTDVLLPPGLANKQPATLDSVGVQEHRTKPPPRYTEASLVKALEKHGVGRPSTYGQTLATLQSRHYAEVKSRQLHATDLGLRVCALLVRHFPALFDLGFTAKVELALDQIASGKLEYQRTLSTFYHDRLMRAMRSAESAKAPLPT